MFDFDSFMSWLQILVSLGTMIVVIAIVNHFWPGKSGFRNSIKLYTTDQILFFLIFGRLSPRDKVLLVPFREGVVKPMLKSLAETLERAYKEEVDLLNEIKKMKQAGVKSAGLYNKLESKSGKLAQCRRRIRWAEFEFRGARGVAQRVCWSNAPESFKDYLI